MNPALDPGYAGYIKKYYGLEQKLRDQFPEGEVLPVDTQTAIVYLPLERGGMPSIQKFGYNSIPKLFTPMDYAVASEVGALQLRSLPALRLTGRGTFVGIVDSGIDLRHPAFRDSFGRTRVKYLWDMTDQTGNPPALFGFGSEYGKEQINTLLFSGEEAPLPGYDPTGHGTGIAGIAAGSESSENAFTGMAPGADLVVVKLKEAKEYLKEYYQADPSGPCYSEDDLMLGIRYVIDQAERNGEPVSLAWGLGSSLGSHTGSSPLSLYANRIVNSVGAFMSVAAGNEGNEPSHYAGSAALGEERDVQLRVGDQVRGFTMELWGTIPGSYQTAIVSPTGERVRIQPRGRDADIPIDFLFENTKIYIDSVLAEEESGLPLIQYRFSDPAPGIWTIQVRSGAEEGEIRWDMWLPTGKLLNADVAFLEPNPFVTVTEPGNARDVTTLTAYQSVSGALYLNAGRGYTADERVVPSMAAPGIEILVPVPGGGYGRFSGTSLAAGIGAGCGALFLEWGIVLGREPFLTGVRIRNYLIRGAVRDGKETYPNRQWGYGKLDLYEAFLSLRL